MKLTPLKNTNPNTAANPSPIREKFLSRHIPILPEQHSSFYKKNYFTYILIFFAAVQILFLSYMNLFESPIMIDYDGAKLYKHAIEMWNHKTLFIPDWKYITTMELDCSLLLALPFYALCRNIFLSFGIANILLIFTYVAVVYAIFQRTPYQKYAFLAVNLILIPYSSGMLEYFNMMFFNGAQYVLKVLIPLLFILLLTTEREKRKGIPNRILFILYTLLLFITSLSSGVYVMFCGIVPLILCGFLDFMMDGGFKKYNRYHIWLCFASFIAFGCGTLAGKIVGINARGNLMLLTKTENWQSNFHAVLLGIFQVLDSVPSGDIAAVSAKGLLYLAKIFLILLLLTVCILQIKDIWKPADSIDAKRFLAFLFPWNLAILLFIDSRYSPSNLTIEYRYFLIGILPLMILLPMQIGKWMENASVFCRRCVSLFICLGLLVLCAGSARNIWERREISLYVNDICSFIDSLDMETESVFFIPDEETPEMCRLLDETRTYCSYNPEHGGLVVYDYYQSYIDRSSHGDKNLIFVYNWETPDMYLPAYISVQYEKVGSVRWYDAYYAPINLFDSVSGFPSSSSSTDFFFSPGYVSNPSNSFINDNGELEVTGNGEESVSNGAFPEADGTYQIKLFYEESTETAPGVPIGIMELRNQNGVIASTELLSGQNSVISEDIVADNESLSLHIRIYEGISCRLESLHFTKIY